MSTSGSCLCGGIRYEVDDGAWGPVINCHCSMCRKATGAAFRTRAAVATSGFCFLAGEELVARYESSPGETRTFCRQCGATLPTFFRDRPEEIGLPLGTLDDDPGVRPSAHVFVGSQAPWHTITDGLPRDDGPSLVLVALLTVRRAAEREYRLYEQQVAAIMTNHGGRIERVVAIAGEGDTFREVHLVRFPSPEALAAYRADPAFAALAETRARLIAATEILTGADGPGYDPLRPSTSRMS